MSPANAGTLCVAAVACKCPPGEAAANVARHAQWIERGIAAGARFIGFPECSLTGYACRADLAITLASPVVEAIVGLARARRVYVSAGLVERRGRCFFNAQIMAGPDGLLGIMRKVNLTAAERKFFAAGRAFPVFPVGSARVGIAICADATHPETARVLALRGATVIFAPHATYLQHTPQSWLVWRRARWPLYAQDCGAWFVGCNNAGRFTRSAADRDDLGFASGALVIDPQGKTISQSAIRTNRETMVVADLDLRGIHAKQKKLPCFRGLRTDVFYRGLLPKCTQGCTWDDYGERLR
jgi:predicted amidohydrolase